MARRARWMRAIAGVLVGGALAGGGFAFWQYASTAEYLRVKTITIGGARVLSETELALASGVTSSDNLLLVDPEEVAARLEALPYVRTCSASRVFPDEVLIEVEERVPAATVLQRNRLFAVDAEGVVLRECAGGKGYPGVLITELPDVDVLEPGQRLDSEPFRCALEVLGAFAGTKMAQDVSVAEVAAYSANDIRMYCEEVPAEIRWGRGDPKEQARRLDALWAFKDKDLECDEYCDLRFGMDVACR